MKRSLDKVLNQEEASVIEEKINTTRFENLSDNIDVDQIKKYLQYCIYYSKYRQASNLIQHALKEYHREIWYKYYDLLIFVQKDVLNPLLHPEFFIEKVDDLLSNGVNIDTLRNLIYFFLYIAESKKNDKELINKSVDLSTSFNKIKDYLKNNGIDVENAFFDFQNEFDELTQFKSESEQNFKNQQVETPENKNLYELSAEEISDKIAFYEGQLKLYRDKLISLQSPSIKVLKDQEYDFMKVKVAIIGDTQVNENDLNGIFKSEGFNKNNLNIYSDYAKLKNFNIREFQYSDKFDCILVGPIPHKMPNIGNYNSLLELLKQEEGYPFTLKVKTESNELKITKSALKKALKSVKAYLISNRGDIKHT